MTICCMGLSAAQHTSCPYKLTHDKSTMLSSELNMLALHNINCVACTLSLEVEKDGRTRCCSLPIGSIGPEALWPIADAVKIAMARHGGKTKWSVGKLSRAAPARFRALRFTGETTHFSVSK